MILFCVILNQTRLTRQTHTSVPSLSATTYSQNLTVKNYNLIKAQWPRLLHDESVINLDLHAYIKCCTLFCRSVKSAVHCFLVYCAIFLSLFTFQLSASLLFVSLPSFSYFPTLLLVFVLSIVLLLVFLLFLVFIAIP